MAYEPAPLPSLALVGGFSNVGGASYTLTAASGTYTLSGQITFGFKARTLAAGTGIYTVAGQAGYADYHLVAAQGLFALTGNPAGLTASQRRLAANPGTYSFTGHAVNLLAIEQVFTLTAERGTYTLNTFSVTLTETAALTGNKVKLRTFVYASPATVTGVVSVTGEAIINATPDVFFIQGTADTENISGYASGTGTLVYTTATGSLGSGVTLGPNGVLTYNGTGGPGVHRISIRADNVQVGDRFGFAQIPELVFIEGIAETEELGVYQLDPDNLWTPGDLTNANGWTAVVSCELKSGTANVGDAWLAYNQATGRLTYSGAAITGAARDYTVHLDTGTQQSATFRIRILRPTHAYGFGSAPGDAVAANGWTGAAAIDATTAGWNQAGVGPVRVGGQGPTDAAPRVIYMCGQDFPSQSWLVSLTNKPNANITSYCYILGDPDRRPHLSKVGGANGKMGMRSNSTIWVVKNLSLEHVALYEISLTSNRKHKTIWHKIKQVNADGGGSGGDALGSSFDYAPFAYPSLDRIDATDNSLGTYFHTYITFFEGIGNGNQGGAQHQMYAEGNGTSATFVNASLFAGAQACSTLKTIQAELRVRNTLLSVAPDYDTFASNSDPAVNWAQELIDVKATTACSLYNNEFRVGVSSGNRAGGTRKAAFIRKRRTAFGGDTPPYPDDNWNPPLGDGGHQPIVGFAIDASTFANTAYWNAVAATDILSPDHLYSFKRYISHNTFRLMFGGKSAVLRDDGTHPTEATAQFLRSTILGTHPGWVERSVSFLANNRHVGWLSTDNRYELDDSDAVDIIEDGTGNAQRSYFVTWNDGVQGYVRVNMFTNANTPETVKSWSSSLGAHMTALGGTALNGVPWATVQANLTAQVLQPFYPPALFGPTRDQPKAVEVGGISFDNLPTPPIDLPPWFEI